MAPPGSDAKSAARAAELLRRFDANGDGKLDDDERAIAKEAMREEQTNRMTTGGAGLPGGPAAFRARMLEMFDRNRDGRLDDEERAAAQKFAEERGLGADGEPRAELLRRFDRNGNGRIDDEERPALREYLQDRASKGPSATGPGDLERLLRSAIQGNAGLRQRFDRNGDGRLDDAEWAEARRELQRSLTGPAPGPKSEEEERRLAEVAAELARRRQQQESTPAK